MPWFKKEEPSMQLNAIQKKYGEFIKTAHELLVVEYQEQLRKYRQANGEEMSLNQQTAYLVGRITEVADEINSISPEILKDGLLNYALTDWRGENFVQNMAWTGAWLQYSSKTIE